MPTQVAKAPMGLIHTDFSTIAPLALGLTRSVQTLSVTLALVLFSLWLLGVLVVGLWQVYSYVQFRRWQHKGIFPVSELDELKILKRVDSNAAFLIAVNPSDEKRFSPEEWQNILAQIERGEVFWEDSPELKEYKAKVERGEMTWSEVRAVQKNNK